MNIRAPCAMTMELVKPPEFIPETVAGPTAIIHASTPGPARSRQLTWLRHAGRRFVRRRSAQAVPALPNNALAGSISVLLWIDIFADHSTADKIIDHRHRFLDRPGGMAYNV
jgi:hypothetical protein